MKIIENNILPPKGYKAITLLNYIFVRKGVRLADTDLRHEAIHWEQEKELLIAGFYLLYIAEFLIRLTWYGNWHTAYRNISFESEAYVRQSEADYLYYRRHYAWFKYIKNNSL